MTIGDRLREERERLKLSQPNFAAIAGTTKQTLFSWESGKTAPDGFLLAAFAAAGVDVLYVVTGQRSQGAAEVDLLPSDERVLVDAYRRCNADARRNLIQTAALLSAGMPSAGAPAAPSKMVNKAAGSVQVGHQSGGRNEVINKGKKAG